MTVDEATALKVRRELVAKGRMPVKLLHEALDRIEGPVEREDERASIAIEKLDIVVHFGAGGTDVRVLPPKSERDE